MGSWNVLDAIAIADCALEIHGRDLDDLFATAARALADVMVDPDTVSRGVERTLLLVMLHCGSRGFGHQVGTDYLRSFDEAMPRLACAPFRSPEGQAYFGAMTAAANTAFANRQLITHRVREVGEVVDTVHRLDISRRVVSLRPIGNIKG